MSNQIPVRARVVIVGGGVIGTSTAYHLTKLGVKDVVLLERQQLTSGTTWHAAGLIASGGTHSETSSWIVRYTRDLYARVLEEETGLSTGFRQCGYLQLATTPRRQEAYRRETAFLQSFGVDKREISAAECGELHPLLRTDDILSGFYTADEGRANPVDVTMALARGAKNGGAQIVENCEVTGFTTKRGAVTGVVTSQGQIDAETVILCSGLWTRDLAAKVGVTVPLQATEHYYLLTEPIDGISPDQPVVEDTERYGYYREEGAGMLVGLFEPVAAPWALDGPPRDSAFAVLPPDWDRLTPYLASAMERFPILADAGIKTLFCGPESFTPDLSPMVGEAPNLSGLFVAAGMNSIGILTGGGIGSILAQWVVDGLPPVDVVGMHVDRAEPHEVTRKFRADRSVEQLGVLLNDGSWPTYAPRSARGVRRSVLHDRLAAGGAYFNTTHGWEYPDFFGPAGSTPEVAWEFGRQPFYAHVEVEHNAVREGVAVFDMTLMAKFLVQGKDAVSVLNRVCTSDIDVEPGRIVYTTWCDEAGGLLADLTVTRLGDTRFLVVASDVIHHRVPAWISRNVADNESVVVTDVTSGITLLSVQGPQTRELLSRLTPNDLSNDAFPYLTAQDIEIGYAPVRAVRVTYVGELGWELHIPTEYAPSVFDLLHEAGEDLGFRNAGMLSLSGLRQEKGYRDYGSDIDNSDSPYEVGLGFTVHLDKSAGFIGRDALAKQVQNPPLTSRLASFVLTDPEPLLLGDEPIYRDGTCVGYIRSGAFGYTLGASVGLGMVEDESGLSAADVTGASYEIDVAGRRVAATASLKPLYDPQRLRPQM